MKNQVIYNTLGLYVGPAPSSGYHFISTGGTLNNDFNDYVNNYNLIFPLNRIISTSYSITPQRTNMSYLGDLGTFARPIFNNTEVTLNFDYYLMGLINEARLGMMINIPSGDPITGTLLYGTGYVCPISGFYTRDETRTKEITIGTSGWPLKVREPKNIFVAAKKQENFDLNDIADSLDSKTGIDVYAFGDCFMNSYSCSAGVNQVPTVSVNYICNNVEVYSSGYNCDIPALNTQTNNIYSGIYFNIPNNFQGSGLPMVFLPSDIIVNIIKKNPIITLGINHLVDEFGNKFTSQDGYHLVEYFNIYSYNPTNLIVDFNDIKIQNFDFSIDLNRIPINSIGYKLPQDRILKFPIISNLSFNFVPGDNQAGSLVSLFKTDEEYNISIKLQYENRLKLLTGVGIQYDFIGVKFEGFSENISVSQRKNSSLNFSVELDPNKTTKGLFMSGYLGIPLSTLKTSGIILY